MVKILISVCLMGLCSSLFCQKIVIDSAFGYQRITTQSWSYSDSTMQLQIDDIQEIPLSEWKQVPQVGFTYIQNDMSHWIYAKLYSIIDVSIYLVVNFTLMDSLVLFTIVDNEVYESKNLGDIQNPKNREIPYRLPAFEINLKKNKEHSLYLFGYKDKSVGVLPISIYSKREFYRKLTSGENEMGIIYGLFISFISIAFLSLIYFKDWSYLWYALYVSSLLLWILSVFGSGQLYIWSEMIWFNSIAGYFLTLLAFIFFGMLVHSTLSLRENELILSRIVVGLLVYYLIIFTVSSMLYLLDITPLLVHLIKFGHFSTIIFPFSISAIIGYYYWKYRSKKSLYLVLIFSISLSAMIVLPLVPAGIASRSVYEWYKWLFVIECFLLLMVLLQDLFNLKNEKNELLSKIIDQNIIASNNYLEGLRIERKRISQQLHDGVNIRLANLKFNLTTQETIQNENDIDQLSQDIRRISHGLSPITLELHGLLKALEEEIYRIESANNDILIEFKYPDQFKEPETNISETIYFTVLEILQNILKHAEASYIHLNINQLKDKNHLTIENDGKTFKVDANRQNGIGLVNIISRIKLLGGHITIQPDNYRNVMTYEVRI